MSGHYTLQNFQPCLRQAFELIDAEEADKIAIILESVTPYLAPGQQQVDEKAFSLLFTGPAEIFLPQGLYALKNQELGRLEIFITPLGRLADNSFQYEAVFN
jgi:hypothetical protein